MNTSGSSSVLKPILDRLIRFCIYHPTWILVAWAALIGYGIWVMPFDFRIPGFERSPVPVDAIPDLGDNQQIIYTEWPGRSPKDIEDQITYPLTRLIQGLPGVKTVRSYSYFGFSSVYIIFEDRIGFYESRTRILEKLSTVRASLPTDVTPMLGPDATGLGQIFWYSVEGEGFSLEELRSIQDWTVRPALSGVAGVSEVASIGGYVREYQIDVDPDRLRRFNIPVTMVRDMVKGANSDIGAMSIDVNSVEYMIRGLGFIRSVKDIEDILLMEVNQTSIRIKDVAHVILGPALRRGILDKAGAEITGGVVVARFAANPFDVIHAVKKRISELESGLPQKIQPDGRVSRARIVPFYDRSDLIHETLETLRHALSEEILITIIVVLIMVLHLRVSFLVSLLLPVGVLSSFILMKTFGVSSNLMSLAGIAIAIGAMVDMGIIVTENLVKVMKESPPEMPPREVVFKAVSEVGSAVVTSILTILVSFLPIFFMTGEEGKLFIPLAWTKTFALGMSVVIALTLTPALAQFILFRRTGFRIPNLLNLFLLICAVALMIWVNLALGILAFLVIGARTAAPYWPDSWKVWVDRVVNAAVILYAVGLLASTWRPLGWENSYLTSLVFVAVLLGAILGFFIFLHHSYEKLIRTFLSHKVLFMMFPMALTLWGFTAWLGWERMVGWTMKPIPASWEKFLKGTSPWTGMTSFFPGLGREFMPTLDEGSFLYMPSTMPHGSVTEAIDSLQMVDQRLKSVPEVESVVGKAGRVESALDPAPLGMIESIVTYKPKYAVDPKTGKRTRQWRPGIETPQDIWNELVKVAEIPGLTSASKLAPIATRLIMLQTGMRAPMGIKIKGPSLEAIEKAGLLLEEKLKHAEGVEAAAVVADRVLGTPYLEIVPDREKLARQGIPLMNFQDTLEVAVGGMAITHTVEGRERYPVRVRYDRERRDSPEALAELPIASPRGSWVHLREVADIRFSPGPMVIKGEDAFLVSYVLFDKKKGFGETDVVEKAGIFLDAERKGGRLNLPPGVTYTFTGNYENQVRSQRTLAVVVPLSLFIIFLILYAQFRRPILTLFIFSEVAVAFAGGMILLWFYGQAGFLNTVVGGISLRELFNVQTIQISVAVWVGFLALFGIANNDGVLMGTYLEDIFRGQRPTTREEIHEMVVRAGLRRILPCLMTTATALIALIPVLSGRGRGSEVMVPMAVPIVGGIIASLVSIYIVPVLYAWWRERQLETESRAGESRLNRLIGGMEMNAGSLTQRVAGILPALIRKIRRKEGTMK